ncbi:MAG: hypothetical protein KBS66_01775 [Eubacterium sp.]|nr:hypothetical protein [Candidatus Colimonas fimequi]
MIKKYRNLVTTYDGEGLMAQPDVAGELAQLAQSMDPVHPTEKYQAQYDSIMEGSIRLLPFRMPEPTKERIRRVLMENAKSQMFASMDDLAEQSRAIKDFVLMTEEKAYLDARAQWEKDRDAHNKMQLDKWRQYANSMKPLLDNDGEFVERNIARWLRSADFPMSFDVSFQLDGDCISLQIDGAPLAKAIKEEARQKAYANLCAYMAAGVFGVAIAASTIRIQVEDGEKICYETEYRDRKVRVEE